MGNESAKFLVNISQLILTDFQTTCPMEKLAQGLSSIYRVFRFIDAGSQSSRNPLSCGITQELFHAKKNNLKVSKKMLSNIKHFIKFGHILTNDWDPYPLSYTIFRNDLVDIEYNSHFHERQCDILEKIIF